MKNRVASVVLNNFTNDSRVLKEGISLQNNGYDVTIVALHKDGLEEFEKVQSIPVHRVKLRSMHWSKNIVASFFKYIEWSYHVIKKYRKYEVMHCHDLNALHLGVISKLFNKKMKIVYDAHEYETERYNQSKMERSVAKVLEKFFLKYTDSVITVSDSIANDYVTLYGIKKPYLVFNTPNLVSVQKKNIFREKFNINQEDTIFLYQGGVSKGRGILEFADLIKNKQNVVYVIMGYGLLESEIKEYASKYDNIYFHEAVSPDVLLNYTSSADIGVCIEENLCKSWDYALPNKMFEYHMVGLPIIVSGLYEMKKFVRENDTGYILDDIYDQQEFDAKFDTILDTYKSKEKNIKRVTEIYNWEVQEKVLLSIYENFEKGNINVK